MEAEPNPMQGVFRWTLHRVAKHIKGFGFGTVALSILFVLIGAALTLPKHPSWQDRAGNGVISFIIALIAVVIMAVLYALLRAPFEQRNKLRNDAVAVAAELNTVRSSALHSVVVTDFQDDRYLVSPDTCNKLVLRFEFSNHGPQQIDFEVLEVNALMSDPSGPCELGTPARDQNVYHLWPDKRTQYEFNIDFDTPQRFPLSGSGHFLIHYGIAGDARRYELLHRFRLLLEPGIPGKCWRDSGGHDIPLPAPASEV